eukprot:Filipodium_phascolosomae@DN929_c0_g1_i1.p1
MTTMPEVEGQLHDEEKADLSEQKELKFCPVETESNSILAGTRVSTPLGVGIVRNVVRTSTPERIMVHFGWGVAYLTEKDLNFNVLPHILHDVDSLRELGDTLFAKKEYQESVECYEKAYKMLPHNFQEHPAGKISIATLCSILSLCCLKCDEPEKGLQWAEHALRVNEDNKKALFRKGQAHARLGNYEEADIIFEQCQKLPKETIDADQLKKEKLLNKTRLRGVSRSEKRYRAATDTIDSEEDEAPPPNKKGTRNSGVVTADTPGENLNRQLPSVKAYLGEVSGSSGRHLNASSSSCRLKIEHVKQCILSTLGLDQPLPSRGYLSLIMMGALLSLGSCMIARRISLSASRCK